MVDKIAVQVDIIFIAAPQVGKPVGIDGMNHDEPDIRPQAPANAFLQQSDLDTGTTESLNPMGSGDKDQNVFCILRPEQSDISKKLPAPLP